MPFIIVDTSSIIFGLSNKKDVFEAVRNHQRAYSPIISEGIIRELKLIRERHEKYSKFAGAALLLISMAHVEITKDSSSVDEWIKKEAVGKGYAVCTNDTALKRSLKTAKIRVFSMTRSGTLR